MVFCLECYKSGEVRLPNNPICKLEYLSYLSANAPEKKCMTDKIVRKYLCVSYLVRLISDEGPIAYMQFSETVS